MAGKEDDTRRDTHEKPYVELVIRIPAKKKDMIQDEIVLKRVAPRTFAAHGYG
jgi:hypothetical protein